MKGAAAVKLALAALETGQPVRLEARGKGVHAQDAGYARIIAGGIEVGFAVRTVEHFVRDFEREEDVALHVGGKLVEPDPLEGLI